MSNFATPWTIACQAPLPIIFSRQKYWSGLPFPALGDLLDPGIKLRSLLHWQVGSLPWVPPGKPEDLFISFRFCFISLYVYFYAIVILYWLLWLCNMFWNQGLWCLQLCSFSRLFWLFRILSCSIQILVLFLFLRKITIGIFIKIVLNLQTSMGGVDILIIFSGEHKMSFNLFVVKFLWWMFCTFQVCFSPPWLSLFLSVLFMILL